LIYVERFNDWWWTAHWFWSERIELFFRWERFFWSDLAVTIGIDLD
jgi:hypothetical protein